MSAGPDTVKCPTRFERLKDRLSEARKEGENARKRYQRVELVELYKMAAFLAGNSASFLSFESDDSTSTRGDRRSSSDRPRERLAFQRKKATPRSETRLSLFGRARASRRAAKERRRGLRGENEDHDGLFSKDDRLAVTFSQRGGAVVRRPTASLQVGLFEPRNKKNEGNSSEKVSKEYITL